MHIKVLILSITDSIPLHPSGFIRETQNNKECVNFVTLFIYYVTLSVLKNTPLYHVEFHAKMIPDPEST
jgi:hypothetical protein